MTANIRVGVDAGGRTRVQLPLYSGGDRFAD